jgi:hypothetical protein
MVAHPTPTDLESALSKRRSRHVSRVVTKIGTDSTGDPAIWIWIILKDTALAEAWPRREDLRLWAEKAVRAAGIEHWVYIAFRTETEQRALEKSTA